MYHPLLLTCFCENFPVEFSSPAFKVYGDGLTGVLADRTAAWSTVLPFRQRDHLQALALFVLDFDPSLGLLL